MHQLPIKHSAQLLLSELVELVVIVFFRKWVNQTNHYITPAIFKILFLAQDLKRIGRGQEWCCLWQPTHCFLPLPLVLITSWGRIQAKFIKMVSTREFPPLSHEQCLHSSPSSCKHKSKNRPKHTPWIGDSAPGASCHTNEINGKLTTKSKPIYDQAQNYLLKFHTYKLAEDLKLLYSLQ